MRFAVGTALLLFILSPASVRAAEAAPALAYEAGSLTCVSQHDQVTAPLKATIQADKQAGQLIAEGARLAIDGPPPARAEPAADTACEVSPPAPSTGTTTVALTARMVRMSSFASRIPLIAGRLTSGFGLRVHPLLGGMRLHSGIDLAAPLGSPIFAVEGGTVGTANWKGGYGLFVALDHGNGLQTRYGHMSRLNVVPGQRVHKGDIIGFVGSTGRSTGAHLHYEVLFKGQAVDPAMLIGRPTAR